MWIDLYLVCCLVFVFQLKFEDDLRITQMFSGKEARVWPHGQVWPHEGYGHIEGCGLMKGVASQRDGLIDGVASQRV